MAGDKHQQGAPRGKRVDTMKRSNQHKAVMFAFEHPGLPHREGCFPTKTPPGRSHPREHAAEVRGMLPSLSGLMLHKANPTYTHDLHSWNSNHGIFRDNLAGDQDVGLLYQFRCMSDRGFSTTSAISPHFLWTAHHHYSYVFAPSPTNEKALSRCTGDRDV